MSVQFVIQHRSSRSPGLPPHLHQRWRVHALNESADGLSPSTSLPPPGLYPSESYVDAGAHKTAVADEDSACAIGAYSGSSASQQRRAHASSTYASGGESVQRHSVSGTAPPCSGATTSARLPLISSGKLCRSAAHRYYWPVVGICPWSPSGAREGPTIRFRSVKRRSRGPTKYATTGQPCKGRSSQTQMVLFFMCIAPLVRFYIALIAVYV